MPVVCNAAPTYDKEKFVNEAIRVAKQIQEEHHIPVSVTVSVAIYESSYGRSQLAREHHNYFGLKANEWNGPTVRTFTVDSGIRRKATFRSYESLKDGFFGFAEFLQKPRYREAFEANNSKDFIRAMLAAGYCPDKKYLKEVSSIIERHNLTRYDKTFENAFAYVHNRG